ncbi:MAG: HAD family hydrolase [Desulfovibrio sp.]|nr:HAD family hydrolase [Desulfovibrio sp.]
MSRGFIFDLDGTTLNTLDDLGNACNLALTAFGYPTHPLPAYKQMVGNGFVLLIMRSLPCGEAESMEKKQFQAILEYAKKAYSQHMMERTRPYEGMTETLEYLADNGALLAVLSNKPEPMTQKLIEHYYPIIPFVRVYGGREDMPLKPDPTRALSILNDFTLAPANVFFVGDSQVDMLTAKNAGMRACGVTWGFRGEEELRVNGADTIAKTPQDLCDLLLHSAKTR